MSLKFFSGYSWLVGFFFVVICFLALTLLSWPVSLGLEDAVSVGGVFCFDTVSLYLVLLSVFLGVSLWFWGLEMSGISGLMISLSVFSSLLCYCCVHALWFWVFYEMSIVSLLALLVIDSPYSERYVASWYLLGYVVITSLPMLLCLYYLSEVEGGFDIRLWNLSGGASFICVLVLAVMFITKIPLPPFHVWLPIVHAEASSPVSVCLSGYIMKLGVLGVFRFCSGLLPTYIFSESYVLLCVFMSLLFFFSATRELDGKRWLAFISLSHILVVSCCLCMGDSGLGNLSFLYCLGHGLSAGVTFLFLWFLYNVSGTRNLALLKSGISSSLFLRIVSCSCLCTVCSLPPTVQFFCEVFLALEGGYSITLFVMFFYFFLFLGGLVPLFLVGTLLSRHYDVVYGVGQGGYSGLFSLSFLILWSFFLFIVC